MVWRQRNAQAGSKAFREKSVPPSDGRNVPKPSAALFPGGLGSTRPSPYTRLGGGNDLNLRYSNAVKDRQVSGQPVRVVFGDDQAMHWEDESFASEKGRRARAEEQTDAEAAAEVRKIMYRPRTKSARQTSGADQVVSHYSPKNDVLFVAHQANFGRTTYMQAGRDTPNTTSGYLQPPALTQSAIEAESEWQTPRPTQYRPQDPTMIPEEAAMLAPSMGHGDARLHASFPHTQTASFLLSPSSGPTRQQLGTNLPSSYFPPQSFYPPYHPQHAPPTLHSVTSGDPGYPAHPYFWPHWPVPPPPPPHAQPAYPPPWAYYPYSQPVWPYMGPSDAHAQPTSSPPSMASRNSMPAADGRGDSTRHRASHVQAPKPFVPQPPQEAESGSPTRPQNTSGDTFVDRALPPASLTKAHRGIIDSYRDEAVLMTPPLVPELIPRHNVPVAQSTALRGTTSSSHKLSPPKDTAASITHAHHTPVLATNEYEWVCMDENFSDTATETDESSDLPLFNDPGKADDPDYEPVEVPCTTALTSLSFVIPPSLSTELDPKKSRAAKRKLSKSSPTNSLGTTEESKLRPVRLASEEQRSAGPRGLKSALRSSRPLSAETSGPDAESSPRKRVKFDLDDLESQDVNHSQRSLDHDPSIDGFSDDEEDAALARALQSGELEELEKKTQANARFERQAAKAKEDKWVGATKGFFDTVRAGVAGFQVWRDVPSTQAK